MAVLPGDKGVNTCASPDWTLATSAQWSANTARSLERQWRWMRNPQVEASVTSMEGLKRKTGVDRALLKCEGSAGGEDVLLSGQRTGGRGAPMVLLPIFPV